VVALSIAHTWRAIGSGDGTSGAAPSSATSQPSGCRGRRGGCNPSGPSPERTDARPRMMGPCESGTSASRSG
jgi:hypothetical protein